MVLVGRMSIPIMTRSVFRRRKVGRRPRGKCPINPAINQPSAMRHSVMEDTVLRCNPEILAMSARETGCRLRTKFNTIRRLISRAVSLEAT